MEDERHTPLRENRDELPIVIVAASRFYREALAQALLESTVAAVAPVEKDVVTRIRELEPSVVLLDLPANRAHELIRSIRRVRPAVRIVALAVPETERAIVEWAHAGASACVTVDTALADLPSLINEVARGNPVGTARVAGLLFNRLREFDIDHGEDHPVPRLTDRELMVLRLVAEGLSNKEIARSLVIRLPTVKNHLQNIFGKLGVRRRSEAARWLRGTSTS